ncbi:hypothetical protein [Streptomyces sp. LUP30]|uniref:hypothetical protein n=1 Tax=Streptomyces sp. LUP30 TaxID=1890285 RepID=UPI000851C63C|nr:hypothetical protein [Streptomyces sp. LUP30]
MATSSQTQLTAAIALTQLLTDHPGLTLLNWRVPRDGMYAGVLQGDLMMDVDAREVVAAWHEALGGTVCEHTHSFRDEERRAFHLESRWRDVLVDVHVSCPVSALAGVAVAA